MDNLTKQIEEIEALSAIYDKDWQTEDEENRVFSIKIKDNENYVNLYFKLPNDYPLSSPPSYEISAPHLNNSEKLNLKHLLDETYLSNIGQSIIFQWIEVVREEIQSNSENKNKRIDSSSDNESSIVENSIIENQKISNNNLIDSECEITHGEVIFDRKSSFQGHAATILTIDQVHQVLDKLKENRKIANATHNIYAYRICKENTFIQDCEDDGEAQAGGRLLHLLQILDVKNVIVVVTRWYGGVHLGPDRFRHINNAARQVLEVSTLIPDNKLHKK